MMNNVEIIRGINMTIEGLEVIKTALTAVGTETPVTKEKAQKSEPMNTPVEEKETEGTAEEVITGKFDVEQLKSMKYNDFKKLASQLGVKCTGTRAEIMERILALDVVAENDGDEVTSEPAKEVEDKTPTKSDKSSTGKKLGKKKVDEPVRDEFDEQAEEIAKDTNVEDIIEALSDVDIKATKKNAVEKLAEALRNGLIELDDEDDKEEADEDTTSAEDTSDDGEEITAESYFPELDPQGYNNPDEMSDERKEAVEEKMDEIITAYSEDSLTDDDIASYVEDNATEEEIDLLGDDYDEEDILKLYMELIKRTIDNEGVEHEPSDPYEVADYDMCCGHELKYVKKTKKFICSHCGTEYEAE